MPSIPDVAGSAPATASDRLGAEIGEDELVEDELVEDELLIEEISIDGMCGVY